MDLVNDLFKYNNVFIKYMDQVKLYEEDFRMLDRYQTFLDMMNIWTKYNIYSHERLFTEPRVIFAIKRSMGINDDLFIESGDPIISGLRRNIIDNYLKNKRD